ncbi:MAG TPA: hypothetical protein VLX09_15905 [Stellaceae bacterium]|nr:hypothetical protein [Stellaceae bacterium]
MDATDIPEQQRKSDEILKIGHMPDAVKERENLNFDRRADSWHCC